MGVVKVERKVVHRFVYYFPNVHHFDIMLDGVDLVKVDTRHGVQLLVSGGRLDGNCVLDNFLTGSCC